MNHSVVSQETIDEKPKVKVEIKTPSPNAKEKINNSPSETKVDPVSTSTTNNNVDTNKSELEKNKNNIKAKTPVTEKKKEVVQPIKKTTTIHKKKTIVKIPNNNRNTPLSTVESNITKPVQNNVIDNTLVAKPLKINSVVLQIPDFQEELLTGFTRKTFKVAMGSSQSQITNKDKTQKSIAGSNKNNTEPDLTVVDKTSMWFSDFSLNQGFINVFILILIIIVFTVYRMRTGPSRRI